MSVPSLKKQCRVHGDGSHSNHVSDLSSNHPQLLKIHQTVHLGVIACKHTGLTDSYYIFKPNSKFLGNRNRERCKLPSWRKVRSFLMTGNRGMTGGCRLCLLRRLRYLAILREGSKTSCNSARSFSYFPGNRSHVDLNRATGARLNPLQKIHRYRDGLFEW